MYKLSHTDIYDFAAGVTDQLLVSFPTKTELTCYPVPRGGVPAAYALGEIGRVKGILINLTDNVSEADFILDDLIDSGATRDKYAGAWPAVLFLALINKPYYRNLCTSADKHELDDWLVFPWEHDPDANSDSSADDVPVRLLQYIGEDSERGGLLETPKRFLKAWKFYTSGYDKDAKEILKVFEDGAEDYDEMVLVKDIPFYSQCEHHLAPFFGVAHIAYIPDGKIVGLSKFSRLVDMYARRLQVQERLTSQIATAINETLAPKGVAVVMNARHMCMESRGVCQQGHSTTTSAMTGVFKVNPDTRIEFLELIK